MFFNYFIDFFPDKSTNKTSLIWHDKYIIFMIDLERVLKIDMCILLFTIIIYEKYSVIGCTTLE